MRTFSGILFGILLATVPVEQSLAVFLAPGDILVSEEFHNAGILIDPATGDRSILSAAGPSLSEDGRSCVLPSGPSGIGSDPDGNIILAFYGLAPRIVRVEPTTMTATLVSGCVNPPLCTVLMGLGQMFIQSGAVALEPNGNILVIDVINDAVFRVNPNTGDREVVSGSVSCGFGCPPLEVGTGPSLRNLLGIAVEADGQIVVSKVRTPEPRLLIRIDPFSGDRSILSGGDVGEGPELAPHGVVIGPSGHILVASGFPIKGVVRVDPATGNRTIVSRSNNTGQGVGSGPDISPGTIALEPDGSILVTDIVLSAVVRINAANGNRTILSGTLAIPPVGSGPRIRRLTGITTIPSSFVIDPGRDGDGVPDAFDSCPDDFNPDQLDRDEDGAGDACDPFPDDPNNDLAQCMEDLAACLIAPPPDEDEDGETDGTDRCPDTPIGSEVDDAGCSQQQFCANANPAIGSRKILCYELDWKNDQALMNGHERDCTVEGASCVPRLSFP